MAFSFRAGTNWCHDFPKLARESGFHFNMHGSRVRVDWNRISTIDIERVIHERDFATVDENINSVIDYCLESEYDVKILDSNFVKLFRLAQLSVEYLLYCKQYLDHSVIILKDELRQKIEQNVGMKKEIAILEDTVKSSKEKSKEKCRLIETRIGDSSGEIYKCPHCPKTFVSAMFVNAHVARRHLYTFDTRAPTSPIHEHYRAETEKLHNEIKTLKERLNQAERVIRSSESDKFLGTEKDASKEICVLAKGEQLLQQRRYEEDIGNLKSMLFDEIHALKEREHTVNESILEANVKALVVQQEKEIENLRSQLLERLTPGIESMQIKLHAQENYWKAKLEDIETQRRRDIESLTTELKVTQRAADRIKSEYASKVQDLEKQSLDQSNILVEQGKQLNCLSREISNSQAQANYNYNTRRERDTVGKFQESPSSKVKRDNETNDSETCRKNFNGVGNGEMVIEDVGSESSQGHSDKPIAAQNKYIFNRKDAKRMDFNRTSSVLGERATIKSSSRNLQVSEIVGKMKDKMKLYDMLKDTRRRTSDSKTFDTDARSIKRKSAFHTDNTNSKRSEILEKGSVSSATESTVSTSSVSGSDTESVTADDDVTVKEYETPIVKSSPSVRKASIQDARDMLDNRLRDLGIDPEWEGIPTATFKQKMDIVKHQRNINVRKLVQYNRIKQRILEDVLRRISANRKESGNVALMKKSSLDKLVTRVKSKALKALSSYKDSDKHASAERAENTPSKLRLKQKIELLPQKYKDEQAFENTRRELSLETSGTNTYDSPKVITVTANHNDTSSASSVDSPENVKRMSSTKIIVSDVTRKASSPVGRRQVVASKFSETNDSDSTVARQEDLITSPKNSKSVLRPTSGSFGSLIKKKVLFDLENGKNGATEDDRRKNNDWNISSFRQDENTLWKEKSMSTGNIVLKTWQSDKIAEISKKIEEQLTVARKPPVGSVETILRPKMQNPTDYSIENQLFSSILESPSRNFASPKATSSILLFPRPAPRNLKEPTQHKNELSALKYSDLDTDIDEILQME